MVKYISLMKTTDNFFLGTNNPSQSKVIVIPSMEVLSKALSDNRASPNVKLLVSERKNSRFLLLGIAAIDDWLMLSNDFIKTHYFRAPDGAERKVNVIHVNTVEWEWLNTLFSLFFVTLTHAIDVIDGINKKHIILEWTHTQELTFLNWIPISFSTWCLLE